MSDLYPRIRAAIEARVELARAATGGEWRFLEHDRFDEEMVSGAIEAPPLLWPLVTEVAGKPADFAFIAANHPAWAIRALEADLSRLDRHEATYCEEACQCIHPICTCGSGIWAECPEVEALASVYLEEA